MPAPSCCTTPVELSSGGTSYTLYNPTYTIFRLKKCKSGFCSVPGKKTKHPSPPRCVVWSTLEGMDAIQRDLGRLERWACVNLKVGVGL